jgi:hypothetical protein
MIDDLSKREYRYVWLKKETDSQIYEKFGFVNFLEMIYSIDIDSKKFLEDYELKLGYKKNSLIHCFVNELVVMRNLS